MSLKNSIAALEAGEKIKVVAFGDSLTQGWMVRMGYIDFLTDMLAQRFPSALIEIVNRGVPGDTAEGARYRLREDVLESDPDLVLIQFALNDAFIGVSPFRFKKQMSQIVDAIERDTGAEILLVTSVPLIRPDEDRKADEFYRVLIELAEERRLSIARVHEYWKEAVSRGLSFRGLIQGDGVHPNIDGHRIMAEAVMSVFENSAACKK